jgi:hypothetical protein
MPGGVEAGTRPQPANASPMAHSTKAAAIARASTASTRRRRPVESASTGCAGAAGSQPRRSHTRTALAAVTRRRRTAAARRRRKSSHTRTTSGLHTRAPGVKNGRRSRVSRIKRPDGLVGYRHRPPAVFGFKNLVAGDRPRRARRTGFLAADAFGTPRPGVHSCRPTRLPPRRAEGSLFGQQRVRRR